MLKLNNEIKNAEQNTIDTTKIENTYDYQNLNDALNDILQSIKKIKEYSMFLSKFQKINDNKPQFLKKINDLNQNLNNNKNIVDDLSTTSLNIINDLKNQIRDLIRVMKQNLENLEKIAIIPDLYTSINQIFLKEIELEKGNFDIYCNLKLKEFDVDSETFSNQQDEIIKLSKCLKSAANNTTTENLKEIHDLEDESTIFISRLINEEKKIIQLMSIDLETLEDIREKLPKLYEKLNITLVGN